MITMINVSLAFDISAWSIYNIEFLASSLRNHLAVSIFNRDNCRHFVSLLFATGEVSVAQYNDIWRVIDSLQCKVIC